LDLTLDQGPKLPELLNPKPAFSLFPQLEPIRVSHNDQTAIPKPIPPPFHPRPASIWHWHFPPSQIRWGYTAYFPDFMDSMFCAGGYVYDPELAPDCVASPWYYYSNLPPYLSASKIVASPQSEGWKTTEPKPGSPDLADALTQLAGAWQTQNLSALDVLIPRTGEITVHVEGQEPYALAADDFYNLLRDGITNTKTISYAILDAHKVSDRLAFVSAKHTFLDPWGRHKAITHTYSFALTVRGWQITNFESSSYKEEGSSPE
jgi:hypothetical protein